MAKNILVKATATIMLLLLFVSCKSSPSPTINIDDGFNCTVTVNYDNKEYSAKLLRTALSVYEITLLSPSELSGMELKYQGGEVTIEYLGLSHTVSASSIPESAFFAALISCIDGATTPDKLEYIGKQDSVCHYVGTYDLNKFDLFYDSQNKRIEKIVINNLSLTVLFKYV